MKILEFKNKGRVHHSINFPTKHVNQYFAYIRVSTPRQGEQGVSLQEQKSEIERYASRKNLKVAEWFEERETAAKLGRPVFSRMLKKLRSGSIRGVIIHKIDRSARNLKDWADLGQLIDEGIEVHFTRESLDLTSPSGRLAADVQAVVAANYIRNLREETRKGFYGRLKQGVYPMPAPLGYLDAGPGKPKNIDPVKGPLVRSAFLLYATGRYSHFSLRDKLHDMGLRSRTGGKLSRNTLAGILRNPFYFGLIRINHIAETFAGRHQPLITKKLFDQVQQTLSGNTIRASRDHEFLFSRLIRCSACNRSLIAETQKGFVYYRCHTQSCQTATFREEVIEAAAQNKMKGLKLHPQEISLLDRYVSRKQATLREEQQKQTAQIEIQLASTRGRLERLTDAYIDGHLDAQAYGERKTTLLAERLEYEQQLQALKADPASCLNRLNEFVELVKRAYLQYENGNLAEKRQLLLEAMSNRVADGKTLDFVLKSALSEVATRPRCSNGGPCRDKHRTFWSRLLEFVGSAESHKRSTEPSIRLAA